MSLVKRLTACGLVPVTALGLAIGAPLAVGASDSHRSQTTRHRVEISADAVSPPVTGEPIVGPEGQRIIPITAENVLSGDVVGTTFGATFVSGRPEVGLGAGGGVSVWTVTDSPCGAGTLIVSVAGHGQLVGDNTGVWRIAAGAGTGDLVGAGGGGLLRTPAAGHSELVGSIRCS